MSNSTRRAIAAAGFWLLTLASAPMSAQRGGPPVAVDPAAAERGKGLYSANCSFCHGNTGTGTEQAPALVRNYLVSQDRNGELIGQVVKEGRPALGMPAFASLQPPQIMDIVAYIRVMNAQSRPTGLPETALLVGDAKAGEAYFNGAGKCSTCHSPTGDLKGIGGKYTPLPLTIAFLTPQATKPVTVKVTPSSGPPISGVLEYIDEFLVSLLDSNGEHRSWARDTVKTVDVIDPLAPHRAQLIKYTDPDIRNLLAYLVTLK